MQQATESNLEAGAFIIEPQHSKEALFENAFQKAFFCDACMEFSKIPFLPRFCIQIERATYTQTIGSFPACMPCKSNSRAGLIVNCSADST
jgi:hypothetical protein